MTTESTLLWIASCFYTLGYALCYRKHQPGSGWPVLLPGGIGLATQALSLGIRWQRVGHGPFINLYEILSSNLWSLNLALMLFLWLAPQQRRVCRYVAPVLIVLMLWLWLTVPKDTYLPPTYNTIWLYFHVVSGKFFLGLLLLALGMALVEAKTHNNGARASSTQSLSYRLLAAAFCFETLMLLFGAIWAQDAWGRYWSWDPLESWAFLTWLAVIFVLHWRTSRHSQWIYAWLLAGCFTLAFVTFFGIPFISTAPHKGMV